jgi:hypothetical protein
VGFCDGQKWRWGRFSPRTSVSPANLHSICFSTIIFTITRGWHNRPGVTAVPIASNQNKKKTGKYIQTLFHGFPHLIIPEVHLFIFRFEGLSGQSQWPRGLRQGLFSIARTLGSCVLTHSRRGCLCAFFLHLCCSVCR